MAELFENFEVNKQPRWPILTKLVAGSLIVHSVIVLAIMFVPQVREALILAQAFRGVGYRDEAYEKTRIEDRAIMLSLKDGKFEYPPGYFEMIAAEKAGPKTEGPQAAPTPPEAKIVSEYKEEPKKPEKQAKVTPSPIPPAPVASPSPVDAETAQKLEKQKVEQQLNEVAATNGIERPDESKINKAPLKDWLERSNKLLQDGELDLSKTVEIVIVADRQPDGKLKNVEVVRKDGDPRLAEVGKDLASAISDSGVLYFLKDTTRLQMTLKLDNAKVAVRVESDAGTAERASTMARGYGSLLWISGLSMKDKTEGTIYRATKVDSQGKQVVVDFNMSRESASTILKKYTPPSTPAG